MPCSNRNAVPRYMYLRRILRCHSYRGSRCIVALFISAGRPRGAHSKRNGGRPFTKCESEGTADDVHGKCAVGLGVASAAQRQQARVCHRDDPRRIRCRLLW